MMRIDLARLSEERPMLLSASWDAKGRELDVPGIRFEEPVRIAVSAKRDSGLAVAQVDVRSKATMTCVRCLCDFAVKIERSFKLAYALDISEPVVELDDDIRQELILTYPQKVLCREDCRGICPRCGVDLNKERCKCQ
ncbi:MAG: DUF177 domain-containing protein [Candidatus Velamenicoccus archaeovorus]